MYLSQVSQESTHLFTCSLNKNEDLRNKCIFSEPKCVASSVLIVRTNKQAINHLQSDRGNLPRIQVSFARGILSAK